jgi:restriction system protein
MPIPDYQSLMLPMLKRAAQSELRVLEAEKLMGDEFGLTPEEREQLLPSGKQRILHNRAHWAKFYLMKAGLVKFPNRGTFVATETGRTLLASNPSKIDVEVLRQYPSFEEFYGSSHEPAVEKRLDTIPAPTGSSTIPSATPEEQIEKAFLTGRAIWGRVVTSASRSPAAPPETKAALITLPHLRKERTLATGHLSTGAPWINAPAPA